MADRQDELDEAVEAMMTDAEQPRLDPSLEALLHIAADLRGMPRRAFREQLKDALRAATPPAPAARRLTPYLQVENAERLLDFLKDAFGAEELCRVPAPHGLAHAEVRIGDSLLQMADATDEFPSAPAAIHLYVPDVDAVHARAVRAGAHAILPPADQDYGDRDSSIRDPFGNHWYIATHRAAAPAQPGAHVPEGLPDVMPYLHPHGAPRLIEFLKRAFDAEETFRHETPDGVVAHAKLRIGDAVLEMGEAHGAFQPMRPAMHLRVDDVDAAYARALAAGAVSLFAPADRDYGERIAGVRDPFDNVWYLGSPLK